MVFVLYYSAMDLEVVDVIEGEATHEAGVGLLAEDPTPDKYGYG